MPQNITEETVYARLMQWFLFAVVLGTVSVLLKRVFAVYLKPEIRWSDVLQDGELFVVAAALAGAALSDIVASRSHHTLLRQLATFGCVVCVMFGAGLYAIAESGHVIKDAPVVAGSMAMFVAAILAGATAIVLKET